MSKRDIQEQDARRQMRIVAGPYNLIGGSVPEIDGEPIEPWCEQAAYQRLLHVAPKVPVPVPPDVVLLPSNSNDAWRIGDAVLRVCWRGDRKRFLKEAQLVSSLPESVPYPRVREWGSDDLFSWILTDYVPGDTLANVWSTTPPSQLRDLVLQFAQLLRTIHEWTPSTEITHLLNDLQAKEIDDELALVGRSVVPLPIAQVRRLITFARSMPFVDESLLDAVDARLLDLADGYRDDAQPRVVIHGDAAPVNVIVRNGKIEALLDFEWTGFGARDLEIVSLLHWVEIHSTDHSWQRLINWMQEGYPELFTVPDIDRRMWLYQIAYYIRGVIVWPPDRAEDELEANHPVRQLRILVDRPIHRMG